MAAAAVTMATAVHAVKWEGDVMTGCCSRVDCYVPVLDCYLCLSLHIDLIYTSSSRQQFFTRTYSCFCNVTVHCSHLLPRRP